MMRIVFMGTPEFSVPILEALVQGGHQVIAVVTQPDKPKGRGKAVQVTPVKERALELGIPVYQPARARDEGFIEQMKELAPDVAVVVAFGQILSQKLWMFRVLAALISMPLFSPNTGEQRPSSGQ